jgi:hypothetical protein
VWKQKVAYRMRKRWMKRKVIVRGSAWRKLHCSYWYVVNSFVSRDVVKVEEKKVQITVLAHTLRDDMFLCFHCC